MKSNGTKVKILSGFYYPESLEDSVESFINNLPDNTDVDVKYTETVSRSGSFYYSALIMYNTNEDEI